MWKSLVGESVNMESLKVKFQVCPPPFSIFTPNPPYDT